MVLLHNLDKTDRQPSTLTIFSEIKKMIFTICSTKHGRFYLIGHGKWMTSHHKIESSGYYPNNQGNKSTIKRNNLF